MRRGSVGELRIERVTIKRLKLDPRNPRLHSDRQIKQTQQRVNAMAQYACEYKTARMTYSATLISTP